MTILPTRNSSSGAPSGFPLCEGWLEKYSTGRSVFGTKNWQRRYCFLTREGLGYGSANPRDRLKVRPNRPLWPSLAKTFISFEKRKKSGEVHLAPVYYVQNVAMAEHPAAPCRSCNGICSAVLPASAPATGKGSKHVPSVSCQGKASAAATTAPQNLRGTGPSSVNTSLRSGGNVTVFYFGISFEEKHKRYLLLLRTDSPQDYIKWTSYLRLYLHEASALTLVPTAHPLEIGRVITVDVNHRRMTNGKEDVPHPTDPFVYHSDPDPCTEEEYRKARHACTIWDEGERDRVVGGAVEFVQLYSRSPEAAADALMEGQDRTATEYMQQVSDELDACVTTANSRSGSDNALSGQFGLTTDTSGGNYNGLSSLNHTARSPLYGMAVSTNASPMARNGGGLANSPRVMYSPPPTGLQTVPAPYLSQLQHSQQQQQSYHSTQPPPRSQQPLQASPPMLHTVAAPPLTHAPTPTPHALDPAPLRSTQMTQQQQQQPQSLQQSFLQTIPAKPLPPGTVPAQQPKQPSSHRGGARSPVGLAARLRQQHFDVNRLLEEDEYSEQSDSGPAMVEPLKGASFNEPFHLPGSNIRSTGMNMGSCGNQMGSPLLNSYNSYNPPSNAQYGVRRV